MRVLIADDEPLIKRSLERACRMRGHQVVGAADGAEAVRLWESQDPELVFLDIRMPKLTGLEVLKKIHKNKTTKIILISATPLDFQNEKLSDLGVDRFVKKPFNDIEQLIVEAEELCMMKFENLRL